MTRLDLLVQAPNLLGFAGMYAAGKKRRVGWALGCVSEVAWAVWATVAHTPGLYPWCAVWAVVYGRNWWLWRPARALRGE